MGWSCKFLCTCGTGFADPFFRLEGPTFKITATDGMDTAIWNVPIALLTAHSAYFRQVHEGSIKTHHPNEISFHGRHPEVFRSFLRYIHFKDFAISEPQPSELECLISSWHFGDTILCVGFKNHTMKLIYDKYARNSICWSTPPPQQWINIWSRQYLDSSLQRFIVDTNARTWVYKEYSPGQIEKWHIVMNDNPDFRCKVMDAIAGIGVDVSRGRKPKPLETYLEKPKDTPKQPTKGKVAKRPHRDDSDEETSDSDFSY